jgi:oligopeptide/dipeptide ABC transporter ATP-binding protein
MYAGRILEEGGTEEVFSNPAHEYTRGLLGSIPNRAKRERDLANIPGRVPSLEEGRPDGCPFHPRCAKAQQVCKGDFPSARAIGAGHTSRCVLRGLQ